MSDNNDVSLKITKLRAEIKTLQDKLESQNLNPSDTQVCIDVIKKNKREIEELSREESILVPVTNAPKVRSHTTKKDFRSFGTI